MLSDEQFAEIRDLVEIAITMPWYPHIKALLADRADLQKRLVEAKIRAQEGDRRDLFIGAMIEVVAAACDRFGPRTPQGRRMRQLLLQAEMMGLEVPDHA